MSDQPIISIECQGVLEVSLEELQDLQGNLKDLTEENYVKLRNSIIEYGFSFPILIWTDTEGKRWIIDAHQRIRTLKKMQAEGYYIPPLPASPVFANSKTQAKKKLLLLNSRYGKIDYNGYEEFINEPGAEIIEEELSDLLAIPEVMMEERVEDEQTQQTSGNPEKVREITCPSCHYQFTLFGNEE